MEKLKLRALVSLVVFMALPFALEAQNNKFTICGHIYDASSGETLLGAAVMLSDSPTPVGAISNSYGFYSLTQPSASSELHLVCSYVGYGAVEAVVLPGRDTVLDFHLQPSEALKAASVSARKESGIQSTYLGAIDVPLAQVKNTPMIFGESDILKAIQLLPGVQGGNEGFTGLYVRGGGPDENLILLDGVSIYNVDHMLGLFSVFQSEAVKKVTLYKGSFPARYGGRISSILDISTNDGNMKETHGTIGIGVISDKFHLEGPIIKDKLSYSLSARGMHTALYAPIIKAVLKDEYYNYYFYDLTGKLSWRIGPKDRLYLAAYKGGDRMKFYQEDNDESSISVDGGPVVTHSFNREGIGIFWGNTVTSLRWNHIFSPRLFLNTTAAFNRYQMNMASSSVERGTRNGIAYKNSYEINYNSGIKDLSLKADFDYTPSPSHLIKFGAEYINHTFIPETLSNITSEVNGEEVQEEKLNFLDNRSFRGHDVSVYAEDDLSLGEHFTINPGVHLSLFNTDGRSYWSAQPRFSARYSTGRGFSLKAGYARMAQYVHLLSSAQISLPVDLWVPITKNIKPVVSDQCSLGAYYDGIKGWEFSVEGYYKSMRNILEYKDGTLVIGNSNGWENQVEMGEGLARGLEFFIQKTAGKTTGWLAYTLAKSDRIFPDGTINMGKRFPYKYDRRHSLSLSVDHQLSKCLELNAVWTFASGGTTTLPLRSTAVMEISGDWVQEGDFVQSRNNYRLPPSHRLNVGLSHHKPRRHGETVWNFSIYNVYNYMNPNFVYLEKEAEWRPDGEYEPKVLLKKITILPILPSISYTHNF